MKIVNIKKFLRSVLIIIGLTLIICLISSNITLSHIEPTQKVISISSGDTLWSIAEYEQENNEYYKDFDIRDIIYNIKKLNNLDTNINLQVGQKIVLNKI